MNWLAGWLWGLNKTICVKCSVRSLAHGKCHRCSVNVRSLPSPLMLFLVVPRRRENAQFVYIKWMFKALVSKRGLQTNSINITWETATNTNYLAPTLDPLNWRLWRWGPSVCVVTSPPGDSSLCSRERSMALRYTWGLSEKKSILC